MRRRKVLSLLGGAAILSPFTARAAGEPAKVFRLGVLQPGPPGPGYRAFLQQLRGLGWEEGRNLHIDYVQVDSTDADRSVLGGGGQLASGACSFDPRGGISDRRG